MKANAAKNNKIIHSKPGCFEMPSSLQENITTAIHGAFEVAVEIAVLEVTKLISAAAGDMYERIQLENEALKEELQKARSFIDSVCSQAGTVGNQNGQLPQDNIASNTTAAERNVYKCEPKGKGTRPEDQAPSSQHHENEEARQYYTSQEDAVSGLQISNWANDAVDNVQSTRNTFSNSKSTGTNKESTLDCDVKAERTNQPCMFDEVDISPAVPFADDGTRQLVKVKVEKPEEILIASEGLVGSFKEDAMSQLQSEIMQEWTPEVSHFESDEHNVTLQEHGLPLNMNFSLDTTLDSSSSLNVNLPVHVTDQAPTQDPSPLHSYGSHVRRNHGSTKSNLHLCKLCGLNFPLASLLRRHYGQCQQKLSQRVYVPTVGGKRTKLQLYPPGCSPFRCTECNREFNRLENLKTHQRIHTGERPYKCSVCSTAFRHSGALTRHFRIHTGEKPYVCGLCGKSFRNCGGLKFHQRSHNKQLQN